MTLQSSGAISILQVRSELSLSGQLDLEATSVRNLLGIASGQINLESAYSKSNYYGYRPSTYSTTGTGSVTTPANIYDTGTATTVDTTTYGTVTATSGSTITATFSGLTGAISKAGTLYIRGSITCTTNNGYTGSCSISYSTTGTGGSYTTIASATGSSIALTTWSVALTCIPANIAIQVVATNQKYLTYIGSGSSTLYDIVFVG